MVGALTSASEGEAISTNIMNQRDNISQFMKEGREIERNIFAGLFNEKKEKITTKERWILFDAIDSSYIHVGFNILLHNIYKIATERGYDLHIVISANEYELVKDEQCFDVIEGKYVDIGSYEDYAKCIMSSRKYKDKSNAQYRVKVQKEEDMRKNKVVEEKAKEKSDWMRPREPKLKNKYRNNVGAYDR